MKNYVYTVEIEPAEEGGFVVNVPALGCATQGETYAEAVEMAQDCIVGHLEALNKAGQPIPEEKYSSRRLSLNVRIPEVA